MRFLFNDEKNLGYSLIGVLKITRSILFKFLSNLVKNLIFLLNFLIIDLYFLDFSNTKKFLEIFFCIEAFNIDEPINPQPIIRILLNIFKNSIHSFKEYLVFFCVANCKS